MFSMFFRRSNDFLFEKSFCESNGSVDIVSLQRNSSFRILAIFGLINSCINLLVFIRGCEKKRFLNFLTNLSYICDSFIASAALEVQGDSLKSAKLIFFQLNCSTFSLLLGGQTFFCLWRRLHWLFTVSRG